MVSPSSSSQSSVDLKITGPVSFTQTNLVADVSEYSPKMIDPVLVNAWGLAFSDEGTPWVNATESGVSAVYSASGQKVIPAIGIPFNGEPGNPTGIMYNETNDFIIPTTGDKSEFIFSTENGTILAWATGRKATTVADRSGEEAVYKGLAIAQNGGSNFLYATDFKNAKVDVFDHEFKYIETTGFVDPTLPAGYAPFNIREINGQLYVTYAKQLGPDNEDDEAGPGNGYVDIYTPNGDLVMRFASQGVLNSPWGIAQVPGHNAIMIGNFGDGKINVFGPDGKFMTSVKAENGTDDLVIEGLWALIFAENDLPAVHSRLYFTAGPDEETHGVFGVLTPTVDDELTANVDQ